MLILSTIIITALVCNGLQIATGDGMILEFVRKWLDKHFIVRAFSTNYAKKAYYPILYCIKCMPSIYGTLIALAMLPMSFDLIWQVPVVVLGSVCLSTIVNQNWL